MKLVAVSLQGDSAVYVAALDLSSGWPSREPMGAARPISPRAHASAAAAKARSSGAGSATMARACGPGALSASRNAARMRASRRAISSGGSAESVAILSGDLAPAVNRSPRQPMSTCQPNFQTALASEGER
jgi:hypothetical protein